MKLEIIPSEDAFQPVRYTQPGPTSTPEPDPSPRGGATIALGALFLALVAGGALLWLATPGGSAIAVAETSGGETDGKGPGAAPSTSAEENGVEESRGDPIGALVASVALAGPVYIDSYSSGRLLAAEKSGELWDVLEGIDPRSLRSVSRGNDWVLARGSSWTWDERSWSYRERPLVLRFVREGEEWKLEHVRLKHAQRRRRSRS